MIAQFILKQDRDVIRILVVQVGLSRRVPDDFGDVIQLELVSLTPLDVEYDVGQCIEVQFSGVDHSPTTSSQASAYSITDLL